MCMFYIIDLKKTLEKTEKEKKTDFSQTELKVRMLLLFCYNIWNMTLSIEEGSGTKE